MSLEMKVYMNGEMRRWPTVPTTFWGEKITEVDPV